MPSPVSPIKMTWRSGNQRTRRAKRSRAACRLAPGESLEEPGIYRVERGARDQQLERLPRMEADAG